ncbi:MAG: class I SAM-dependent methyltransferase [Gammaproteobacteria bacterium]|nr:class I SAM-dependent methyltransferase [Gammaproteobacteria bacterium]
MTNQLNYYVNCPICGSSQIKEVLNKPHAFFTSGSASVEKYSVALCHNCSFVFQKSAYTKTYQEAINKLYQNYQQSNQFDFPRRDPKTLDALDFVTHYINIGPQTKVAEFGSDRGDFLYLLKQQTGAQVVGLEPCEQPDAKVPTKIASILQPSSHGQFDVILMKQTFEHIVDPIKAVNNLKTYVKAGGYVYIEVPSLERITEYSLEDFIPDHVSHYSIHTLLKLFKGWSIITWHHEHFLSVILQNKLPQTYLSETFDLSQQLKQLSLFFHDFNKKLYDFKSALIKQSNMGGIIIFFGAGLYFRSLLAAFIDELNRDNLFFIDDNLNENIEPCFGLQRANIDKFKEQPVLVIGCSNDIKSQQAMHHRAATLFSKMSYLYLFSSFSTE